MTKDYEADSIEEETRREVVGQMQSPYTRAEFVAREVEVGIEGWCIPGVDPEPDLVAMAQIRQRAEWNAQAAERAGITWRRTQGTERLVDEAIGLDMAVEQGTDEPLVDWLAGGVDDLETRIIEAETAIGQADASAQLRYHNLAARVTIVEHLSSQNDPKPEPESDSQSHKPGIDGGVYVYTNSLGARITALEQRENLHVQAIGELSGRLRVLEQQINPCPLIADHDRRLSLQLERITELGNQIDKLDDLRAEVGQVWNRLYSNYGDASIGLIELVRRLDADIALIRDAVCPPRGNNQIDPNWNVDDELVNAVVPQNPVISTSRAVELVRQLGRADALFDINGNRVWGEQAVDEVRDLLNVSAERHRRSTSLGTTVDDPGYCERIEQWPDPTPTMLESPVFEAIWQAIKTWDINVPGAYSGYCEANGNHVRAILDAIEGRTGAKNSLVTVLGRRSEHLHQTRDALRAACIELGADATWSDNTNLADVVSKVLTPHVRGRIASEGLVERAGIVKWLRIVGEYVGPGDVTPAAYRRSADKIEAGVHWKDLNNQV